MKIINRKKAELSKRGLELSFTWLFAIIAGAIIIFSAIYATMNLTRASQYAGNTQVAKELSIIFNPLETGTASGKSTSANLGQETRIYNQCFRDGSFGNQKFSLSQKSGILKDWPNPGGEIAINNKYVFSENIEQGKMVYFFSKPFEMPFKVSELIFLTTKNYCFESAPDFVKDEVRSLQLGDVKLFEDGNCTAGDTRVCFNKKCNISVYPACSSGCESEYDLGYTRKEGKQVRFIGSLMYASIFSSPEIYNCNFDRLMKRIQQISYLYSDEASLVSGNCGTEMSSALLGYAGTAYSTTSDSAMDNLKRESEKLDEENSALGECRIW